MPDLRQGYWVAILPGERCDGTLGLGFLARRTYKIPKEGADLEALPDEEQPPFLDQDRYDEGDPETAPPTLEHELVGEKARVDVIVLGKAYAPGGKAVAEFECGIRIGDRLRRVRILGPRRCVFVPPRKKEGREIPQPPRFTEPEPIKELPLSFLHAYGGKTRVIPDDETLKMQRQVEAVMAEEKAAADAKKADAQAAQKAEAERKAKEDKEKALFDSLGARAEAGNKHKEEKLKLGDGSEGYDDEGVRLWGASASKDGTAMLDLAEFEKQRLAEMAAEERQRQEAAERAGQAPPTKKKKRRNALGEIIEVDEAVEILTDDKLAEELAQAKAEQAAQAQALADAAARRGREEVLQNEGTRVLDGWDGGQDAEGDWAGELKAGFQQGDAAEQAARKKRIAERKKQEDAALAEFPELPCPTNPYGKGFLVSPREILVQRLELPQIEDPAAPLTPGDLLQDLMALDRVPLPAGLSTYPRHARPRVDLAGPYPSELKDWDKTLEKQKKGLDLAKDEDVRILRELEKRQKPAVMQPGWFNSAAPTLQWSHLHGNEEVTLTNLTKDGTLFFRLPGRVLEAELDRGRGIERKDLRLDTVVVDAEARTVTLLWRTHFALRSWDELGEYPHLVGWVLDLDIQARRDRDWADRLKASQGDGTAVLDLSMLPPEEEAPLAPAPPPPPPGDGTQALDIEQMGTYRQVDDDGWVKRASDGTVDVTAEEKAKKAEEEYVRKKLAALKAVEDQDKKDAERRAEVAAAIQAGKPVPPKDGPPKGKGQKVKAPA